MILAYLIGIGLIAAVGYTALSSWDDRRIARKQADK